MGTAVVLIDTLENPLANMAECVLPGATWTEKAGTFENVKNRLQAFERAIETTDFVKGEFQIGADLQAGFESRPARAVTAESIRAQMAKVAGLERFGSDVHVPDLSFEQAADMQFAEI
jgi:predicted molibdopterin-dependent oxidoreductase YjgC